MGVRSLKLVVLSARCAALGAAQTCDRATQGGDATFLGTIKEDGTPAVLALRLKIENRQISEVETFVQRRSVRRKASRSKSRPDPERGLVFSFIFFDHSGGKIERGKIRQIEAIVERAPYGMNSGWSNWEDGLSDRAR